MFTLSPNLLFNFFLFFFISCISSLAGNTENHSLVGKQKLLASQGIIICDGVTKFRKTQSRFQM